MARTSSLKSWIPKANNWVVPLVAALLVVTILFLKSSQKNSSVLQNSPTSTDNASVGDGVLIDHEYGYRFEYPKEYKPEKVGGEWEIVLKDLTEKDYERAGNIRIMRDTYSGTNRPVFERILKTNNGYDAKQYVYINCTLRTHS